MVLSGESNAPERVAHSFSSAPMDLTHLPPSLAEDVLARLASRRRTVWDARELVASLRDRQIEVALLDPQFGRAAARGVFLDVKHAPSTGFSLLFRSLTTYARPDLGLVARNRWRRTLLPLDFFIELPEPLRFLREPREHWPMPPALVPCPSERCGFPSNFGRFCVQCGVVTRKGRGLGEGFVAWQQALRATLPESGVTCGCGAIIAEDDLYCAKCGTSNPRPLR
jgi:hypothetical protein